MLGALLLPNSLKAIPTLELEKKREEILLAIGLTNKSTNFKRYVQPLMEAGGIEMTIPDSLKVHCKSIASPFRSKK